MRYEIREMESTRRQVYGRLLHVTNDFHEALDKLLEVQKKDRSRTVALLTSDEGTGHEREVGGNPSEDSVLSQGQ